MGCHLGAKGDKTIDATAQKTDVKTNDSRDKRQHQWYKKMFHEFGGQLAGLGLFLILAFLYFRWEYPEDDTASLMAAGK
jgi:hypothetical protein